MLTKEEIAALMPVIDAGIKAAGVQVFQNNGGTLIQSALAKFQVLVTAEDNSKQNVANTTLGE